MARRGNLVGKARRGKQNVYVLGMPGSGSTWIRQMCEEFTTGKVMKTHGAPIKPMSGFVNVFPYRDPRDALCSTVHRWQREIVEEESFEERCEVIYPQCKNQGFFDVTSWRGFASSTFFKYEEFFPYNTMVLMAEIGLLLGADPKAEEVFLLHETYFIDSVELFTSGAKWNNFCHASHITNKGMPGAWKDMFTPRIAEMVEDDFVPLLIELGYEEDDAWLRSVKQPQK